MAAPKGNQFWRARSSHGRNAAWTDKEQFTDACYEYIQWVEDNPLAEAFTYQGEVAVKSLPKMRAMTLGGLCIFLGITTETWAQYRKRDDFSAITREIDGIIATQKFEGAAAGMLNPNIIARDLGLTDRQDVKHAGEVSFNMGFNGKDGD
jgi:hypothetical protein